VLTLFHGEAARRRASPLSRDGCAVKLDHPKYAKRETNMRMLSCLSLSAGLLVASVSVAAAESDVSVWRWHVSNCLRAQQRAVESAGLYREASAFEVGPGAGQRGQSLNGGDPLYSGDLRAAPQGASDGQ
jgi:hypothetical protein